MSSPAPTLSLVEPVLARPITVAVVGAGEHDLRLVLEALPEGASAVPVAPDMLDAFESIRLREPDLVIVALEPRRALALDLVGRLRTERPTLPILALDRIPDSGAIREAMRSGCRDFLVLPEDTDALQRAVVEAARETPGAARANRGRLVAVMGAKGGSGTTLLAVSLAADLAAREETLLLDLDFGLGDTAVFLDLTVERSVHDVLRDVARLDRELLASSVAKHDSGLRVLAQPATPVDAPAPDTDTVLRCLEVSGELARQVVVDCGARIDEATMATASAADQVVLVCTPDVPSVRAAWVRLGLLDRLGVPPERIALVMNRWGRPGSLGRAEIERHLGRAVLATVTEDSRTVLGAVNDGALLRQRHPTARVTRDLAQLARVVGGEVGATQGGGKARWFQWGR